MCYDLAHQIRWAKHTFSGRCDITPMVCCSFGGHSTPQFLQCAFAESSHSSRDSNSTYIESSFTSDGSYSANIESSLSTHDYRSVDVESDPEVALVSLGNLISNVLLPSQLWCLRKKESLDGIMIYKASEQASPALVPLKITHCITIKGDLSWELSIHGYFSK